MKWFVFFVVMVPLLVSSGWYLHDAWRSRTLENSKYLRRADQYKSGLVEEGLDQWADGIRYPKPANLNEERE